MSERASTQDDKHQIYSQPRHAPNHRENLHTHRQLQFPAQINSPLHCVRRKRTARRQGQRGPSPFSSPVSDPLPQHPSGRCHATSVAFARRHCTDAVVITSPQHKACSRLVPSRASQPRTQRSAQDTDGLILFFLPSSGPRESFAIPCGPVQPKTAEIDPCPATPFVVACRAPSPVIRQRTVKPACLQGQVWQGGQLHSATTTIFNPHRSPKMTSGSSPAMLRSLSRHCRCCSTQ